jgi:hypothetical protein
MAMKDNLPEKKNDEEEEEKKPEPDPETIPRSKGRN